MKTTFLIFLLTAFVWAFCPQEGFSQNNRVDWSAFSSGFAAPSSSTSVVKSSVGQAFVGGSQRANTLVESGFLAAPLLRGPVVGVPEYENLPLTYSLSQNYPNPFNPSTTIRYEIPKRSSVELHLYNLLGQRVATLVNEEKEPGRYSVVWQGLNDVGIRVSSGVYFYQVRAGHYADTRKLVMLK